MSGIHKAGDMDSNSIGAIFMESVPEGFWAGLLNQAGAIGAGGSKPPLSAV
jgi:hypothetical protein